MKKKLLTKRDVEDLLVLIEHARRDMSWGDGGSYNDGDEIDFKDIKRAERAIAVLKRIMLTKPSQ